MTLSTSLVLAALVTLPAQAQSPQPAILSLLDSGADGKLLDQIRRRPDDVRNAFMELFTLTARAERSEERVHHLIQAERLAELYEQAWSDSFFVRRVRQFGQWSADERAEKLEADSLRLAGNAAYRSEGPEAAIRLWERSLTKHRALGDLAGQASVLGNLGAGYYALGQPERALRYHARALELADSAGDHRTRGNALGNIASVHRYLGNRALATEFYGRALEVRPLTGDRDGEVADLNNLALVRADLGDLRGAESQLRRALAINQRDGRDAAAADNLTNLANLATERGAYDSALALYEEGLQLRRRVGDRAGEALALENVGLLHIRWGDYPAALGSLTDALTIVADIGPPGRRGEIRSEIATVRAAMGELQAALGELDYAEAEAGHDEYLEPMLLLQRADLLADLNEDRQAAELYERAKDGFARLDDPAGQAEAAQGLGYLYLAREDLDLAEDALRRALQVQEALEDPRPAALTRVHLGDLQLRRGDTAAARASYRRALATHVGLGDRAAEAMTLGSLARLDRETGVLDGAVAGYRAALSRLDDAPMQPVRWRLHFGLGLTLRAQRRFDGAAVELRHAVDDLEQVGAGITVEERRYRYFDDKWGAFGELARTELERGNAEQAFQVSESMRARQLLDLLARGRAGDAGPSRELIREEQSLRRRIGELSAQLGTGVEAPRGLRGASAERSRRQGVRESLVAARARYERLLLRIEESRPEYASLVTGSPVEPGDVRRLLPADAVLIEYLVSDDWTLAFIVSNGGTAALELPVGRDRLRQLIAFLRGTLSQPSHDVGDELWRTPLRSLYHHLVAPLRDAGYLDGKRLLIVAPHAELHYLPFAALLAPAPGGERFLVEDLDVSYVPSASVWARLATRGRGTRGSGLLAMAPLPEALPHSIGEVRAIGRTDPEARIIIGPDASEAGFVALAPGRRIVHLATAGVLNGRNPLFSYVRLRPGQGKDGRLEVHEVFDLSLAADLVVLSACETGLGTGARTDVPPGDDWVGLVRAFLFAGAGSVIASLWPVEDEATARLMEKLYEGLGNGVSGAHALGEAQRAFIRDRERSSPFYWGAFGLTGNAR